METVLVEHGSLEVRAMGSDFLVFELFAPAHGCGGCKVGSSFFVDHFEGEIVVLALAGLLNLSVLHVINNYYENTTLYKYPFRLTSSLLLVRVTSYKFSGQNG